MTRSSRLIVILTLMLVFALVTSGSVFAAAPGGITMSESITADADTTPPALTLNEVASTVVPGMYDDFSVTVVANSYKDHLVKGKIKCTAPDGRTTSDFEIMYLEQDPSNANYKHYLGPLSFDQNGVAYFGPSDGFALQDMGGSSATPPSIFRVKWLDGASGSYQFEVSLVLQENGVEITSTTQTVTVDTGNAMNLTWGTNPTGTYDLNATGSLSVTASLANASHLDGCLFVIEVQRFGKAASGEDFTIDTVGGGDTQGINNTFTVEGDVLQGYWGPATGFTFETTTTTEMTFHFNKAGQYDVEIYAIQVTPPDVLNDYPTTYPTQ